MGRGVDPGEQLIFEYLWPFLSNWFLVFYDVDHSTGWCRKLEMLERGEWFTLKWENCYGKAIKNKLKVGWEMGKVEDTIAQVVQARRLGKV